MTNTTKSHNNNKEDKSKTCGSIPTPSRIIPLRLAYLIVFFHIFTCAEAQDFTSILESIEQNSITLLAHRAKAYADIQDSKVSTVLDDPDVGFNYLFGNGDIGNRKDISISQSFDFPTTIIQRNKFARELRRVADLNYLSARQKVLLEVRKLCIEVVYCNAMMEHLNDDLEETHKMEEAYNTLYDKGEATIIDRNKAHQAVIFFEAEYREFMTTRNNLLSQLRYMNNGKDVIINEASFSDVPLANNFSEWLDQNINRHPSLQLAEGEISAQKRNVSLAKNQLAPKFRIGYMSEFEKVNHYQGIAVGLSIPIWSGGRRIKAAKAHLVAAEIKRADTKNQLSIQLESIFNDAIQLQETITQYKRHLSECDEENNEALAKSLSAGQITLLTYLQECQAVHEMHERLLEAQRDYHLRLAELTF